jgi:hydrogenase maturation protease
LTEHRVFVGGVGNPWLGDLDFGPQFIRRYLDADWPPNVVLEDAAVAAHRVLHQLQDAMADRVIFVAGFPRGDEPGTIRRYPVAEHMEAMDDEEVAGRLGEAAGGVIDFDHTLVVARYYDALPADTIVVEVEAVDERFGTVFSPTVEASFERVFEIVMEEVRRPFAEPSAVTSMRGGSGDG